MKQKGFSIRKRIRSFGYAFNGLRILIREEENAKIHVLASLCVLIAGVLLKISQIEWVAIILAIGLVISLEAINTSIENIADFVSPEKHMWIKRIKDLSAAGVLIGAITAAIVGLIIFVPKLLELFQK